MSFSNYLETALINATLRGVAYAAPATVYLALYTSNPTDADVGVEVAGGSYARQVITFAAPVGGVTSNSALVSFPIPTADWGTVTHFGIRDALSGGNLLYHEELVDPFTISSGQRIVFNAGEVTVTLQ
jgi:hypothetical protein